MLFFFLQYLKNLSLYNFKTLMELLKISEFLNQSLLLGKSTAEQKKVKFETMLSSARTG